MANGKRKGAADSEVRARIVRAASDIIGREGFDRVTAPRLAADIGLQRPIIYYYFDDMDQIRIAAVRLTYEEAKATAMARLASEPPVDVFWRIFENAAAPLSELTAHALRGGPFRPLLTEIIEDLRSTFGATMQPSGPDARHAGGLDAAGLAFLIQSVSIALATERRLGLSLGHEQVRRFFESALGVSAAHPAAVSR
jgi:AcrR family transcriptional regulator